ncbi:hypothetical protein B4U80_04436 [Leptotrombidium deliense]|uniref:Chromo domain-containing protein n=1 Tax=Leptotrombidium deliense TaxID=299467 RepID=A0A443S2C1_9ACAR|nr:hypothetical protein B4U80_04436 [Leptotrombidium deliense]
MFKYFTANGTRKYIDVLQDFVDSYNNTFHRTIKMKPSQVTEKNETEVFHNIYKTSIRNLNKQTHKGLIENNATVRKKLKRNPFDKGYYSNWTDQLFKIHSSSNTKNIPMYTLANEQGEVLKGKFYKEDIQPVRNDSVLRVEKILKRRKRNGKVEYFVKWLNHPNSYNSWEPQESIQNLY